MKGKLQKEHPQTRVPERDTSNIPHFSLDMSDIGMMAQTFCFLECPSVNQKNASCLEVSHSSGPVNRSVPFAFPLPIAGLRNPIFEKHDHFVNRTWQHLDPTEVSRFHQKSTPRLSDWRFPAIPLDHPTPPPHSTPPHPPAKATPP